MRQDLKFRHLLVIWLLQGIIWQQRLKPQDQGDAGHGEARFVHILDHLSISLAELFALKPLEVPILTNETTERTCEMRCSGSAPNRRKICTSGSKGILHKFMQPSLDWVPFLALKLRLATDESLASRTFST